MSRDVSSWDLALGSDAARSFRKAAKKTRCLPMPLEAVIAAVHVDGGLESSRRVVARLFEHELTQVASQQHRPGEDDYKTQVQEWCQRRFDSLPSYTVVRESGPDHDKVFEVEVTVNGESGRQRNRDAARKKQSNRQQSKPCKKAVRDGRSAVVRYHSQKIHKGGR